MNDPEIILPVGSVILMFAVRIKELRTKGRFISGEAKGNLTLRLFVLSGTAMLVCALAEFFLRGKTLYWPTFAVGWILLLLSFALRRQTIKALGKFWSLYVEIRQEHEFVRSGPFRWMRHPAYFSMLLELLAVSILLNAWWSSLIVPLFFFPTLWMRIKLEEQALLDKFGEAYRTYQQTTSALIPLKWPRTH